MKKLMVLVFILSAWLSPPASAETTILGIWKKRAEQTYLEVRLANQLTPKQQSLIDSGFTTFSILSVYDGDLKKLDPQTPPVVKTSCTVKYDTWQEWYEMTKLNVGVENTVVKEFEKYAEGCLAVEITDRELLAKLGPTGGMLTATLLIDQISLSKATEIKDWLIRQQSGVMQGLFSHMLGDLKLNERLDVSVRVPQNLTVSKNTK